MHLITENLLVGNINDAREPPVKIGAVLLVAAEYTMESPGWLSLAGFHFRSMPKPSRSCWTEP